MKISILGVGKVGATVGFKIVTHGLASELVLVNRNQQKARGEALDLQHAAGLSSGRVIVRHGELDATRDSDIVILTLSAPPPADDADRLSLADANADLFAQWVPQITQFSPDSILIVVSNPVDVLTYATLKYSGFPARRVIGTGTLIDSARFRSLLSAHFNIHPDDIRAYILGEHGDSQFPVLSAARAGGWSIADDPAVERFFEQTVRSGRDVYTSKGYTNFAVASSTSMIVDAIANNSHRTIPVSTLVDDFYGVSDVCLSLPVVIARAGIQQTLKLSLNEHEQRQLRNSASRVKAVIEQLRQQGRL